MTTNIGVINMTVWSESNYADYQSHGDFEVENFITTEHRSKAAQWIINKLGIGTHRCIVKVIDNDGDINFELIAAKTSK